MATQPIRVDHPLLVRLRHLAKHAATRFPEEFGHPGLGRLGLILDKKLAQNRYPDCTPVNCVTLANTGGEVVHFSFLVQEGLVCASSPVVVTIPQMFETVVVGESLLDFLCLGFHRGYFGLEQLAYHPELTRKVYTDPNWEPTESWHSSVGFARDKEQNAAQQFLNSKLDLRPWPDPARFQLLHDRFVGLLLLPPMDF